MGHTFDDETGRQYWWPDEAAEQITSQVLGEGWTDIGYTTDEPDARVFLSAPSIDIAEGESEWFKKAIGAFPSPGVISFDVVGAANIGALFGMPVFEKPNQPTHSVVIHTTEHVSGEPSWPDVPRARWWQWRQKRRNEEAFVSYMLERDEWVAAGRPDREILVSRYIPNARITRGHS